MIGNIVAGTFSAGVAPVTSSYESIATVSVGSGGQSALTFSSIGSSWKHLQIRYIANCGSSTNTVLTLNGDTGSNYATHYLGGQGSSAFAGAESSVTRVYTDVMTSGNSSAFGGGIVDILDYGSTSKYKTIRSFSGQDLNGSGYVFFASGLWQNTAAVTSVTLRLSDGSNFPQYTHAALYGIKD